MTNDELHAMLAKAVQGEWQRNGSHIYGPDPERELIGQCLYPSGARTNEVALIVAAVNELPRLLADIDRMRDALQDIAGTGHPDFLSHSQQIARAALEPKP